MEYETLNDEVSRNVAQNVKTKNPYVRVYYNDSFKEKILDIAALITVSSKERGILRFGFSFENVNRKINGAILSFVLVGLASIIIGVFLSTLMARLVTKPVSKIVEYSKAVARGELDLPMSAKSNVTEIRELEQSIEQMKRDLKYVYLGGVFADFHHSIKSDLGLISANIAYIRANSMKLEKSKEIGAKASEIMDRIDLINSEINKYREYKKPQEVRIAPIDINQLISDIVGTMHFPENIVIEKDLGRDIPYISADPNHLKKALFNIVTNAQEAMQDGGRLRIKTVAKESDAMVLVSDQGCGIKKDALTHIFKPSYSTKKKRGGEGIGLAMAKLIIEDVHRGKIGVESEVGAGTTFSIRIPYKNL
jgi:signal transduction histidine kinase